MVAPSPYWLRRIVVTLGPLEEWRGAQTGSTIEFQADGTPKGLRISADINKTIMGMPQASRITLYNLTRDTRNAIKESLTKITVQVGWEETDLHILFQGSVLTCQTEHTRGTDVPTIISALPGYGALAQSVSSKTYGEGVPIRQVLTDLAGDLPGVTVGSTDMEGIEGRLGSGGWSFAGYTKDGLTQLAEEYGFSWQVDDGMFRAVGDNASFGPNVDLNSQTSGLISVNPILTGVIQEKSGVRIKAFYIPGVNPGSRVTLTSGVSPELNGIYRVHSSSISVDSHDGGWTMDLESFTCK